MKIIPKILIVHDNESDAQTLGGYLTSNGCEVVAVSSTEDAQRATALGDIDLAIVSSTPPAPPFFDLVRTLKGAAYTSLIPIVMAIDPRRTEDRAGGVQAGCDDFLEKPFDKDDVVMRVSIVLELSRHRSLLNEQEKFRHVIDTIENGLIVCDQDMKIVHLNDRAREFLSIGQRADKIDLLDVIRRRFTIIYEGDVLAAMRSGTAVFDLERPEREEARALILEARSRVVKNPLRGSQNVLVIVTDVTARRQEEFLKQNFLSLISHKLRTPITVIRSTASLFQDGILGPLTEKQQEAFCGILEKLNGLDGLVDKLLGFTAIEGKASSAAAEKITLDAYLSALLRPIAPRCKDKKVEISIDCPDQDAAVVMNRTHLDLIVRNLIENAIKFNDKDVVKIVVKVRKVTPGVEVSVSDNGRGIPPEEREKIFEKFYQIEKYFTGNVEGAGLGLAIVQRLLSVYGGQVQVRSEIGEGATFTLTIP